MLGEDYYEILGITRDASDREVRRAYREMVKRYHPDLNPDMPDAEPCLRAVVIAYQTLGNRRMRADYDKITLLLGPRRKVPTVGKQGTSQEKPSRLEQRNHEARRSVLIWLTFVLILASVYFVWTMRSSGGLFNPLRVTPQIYGNTVKVAPPPDKVFAKEPVEDQWYLWYRNINYRLFMGGAGSARELSVAYIEASRLALSRGDLILAYKYASGAASIDPDYIEAAELAASIRLRLITLQKR